VLSTGDLQLLRADYGLFSTRPFVGDPGIVLVKHLTELHRVSQLVYFLSYRALYPRQALAQQQRFQGVDIAVATNLDTYEFRPTEVKLTQEEREDEYLSFYFNLGASKEGYTLSVDPFKQRVVISY